MEQKKIILIGKSGSGKTTLIQRMESKSLAYAKTQTIQSHLNFIDTPGEYLENRAYYKALIVTAADADVIGFVQDCSSEERWLPPMFSSAFSKEVIGIVTKADLAADEAQIAAATQHLKAAGADRIFVLSAVENTGMEAFSAYINQSNPGDTGPPPVWGRGEGSIEGSTAQRGD